MSFHNMKEKKLLPSRLNKIVNNNVIDIGHVNDLNNLLNINLPKNISNIIFKYLNKVKFTFNFKIDKEITYFDIPIMYGIDLITGLIIEPNQNVIIYIGGVYLMNPKSDNKGKITFDNPIILKSLPYHSLGFNCDKETITLECINLYNNKELITSSKKNSWIFHSSQIKPVYYFKGILI
jgi:hypothetical protein